MSQQPRGRQRPSSNASSGGGGGAASGGSGEVTRREATGWLIAADAETVRAQVEPLTRFGLINLCINADQKFTSEPQRNKWYSKPSPLGLEAHTGRHDFFFYVNNTRARTFARYNAQTTKSLSDATSYIKGQPLPISL